jgi:hypothetical protein
MTGWKIVYSDRYVVFAPGDDVLDALQEARRLRPKVSLDEIRLVEWQRVIA